jgi:hypothetical protein
LPFADEFNTLVCRASRGTQANLGLMAYRTYMKTAIMIRNLEQLPDKIQRMLQNQKLSACSYLEIIFLEEQLGISLPKMYEQILLRMGHGADFWAGEDCFYRHLPLIQEWAKELLQENDFPIPLPDDAFVFFMHQGYQFSFFKLSEGDNPPTYSYLEGQNEQYFIKTHDKLTDFLATEMDLYEKYSSKLLAA